MSVFADCLKLAEEEKDQISVPYTSLPALKIARLATDFSGLKEEELLKFYLSGQLKLQTI